jgi:hypothetical protein
MNNYAQAAEDYDRAEDSDDFELSSKVDVAKQLISGK